MPYENEHSARLKEPSEFKEKPDWAKGGGKFRRTPDGKIYGRVKVPKTADVIWGQLKNQSGKEAAPQSIRFPTKDWTEQKAKKWLKDNKVKYIKFEPAAPKKKKENAVQQGKETTYHCECIKCGHEMDSKKHCKDLKCPKCGGQMRRKERPGPGQGSAANLSTDVEAVQPTPEELAVIEENYRGFIDTARQYARDEKITVTEAMKIVRKKMPQLYQAFREEEIL